MLRYIKNRENLLAKLIIHIETSAITDLLLKLVICDDYQEGCDAAEVGLANIAH